MAAEQTHRDRAAAISKRARDVPQAARKNYRQAAAGIASPRQAIKAFCMECQGWDRREIPKCTAWACPLWAYRPSFSRRQVEDDAPESSGDAERAHG